MTSRENNYEQPPIPFLNISQLGDLMKGGSLKNVQFKAEIIQEPNCKIPKVIHFIWIGEPLPDKYWKNINTFSGKVL